MNQIATSDTKEVNGPTGPAHAIMISVDMDTPEKTAEFTIEIAERFKVQRMVSPPDTSLLLITVIGQLDGAAFKAAWTQALSSDQVLAFFISQMTIATCMHGTSTGQILDEFSLLPGEQ